MEYNFKRAPFQESRARWALLISCDMPSYHTTTTVPPPPNSTKLQLLLADKKTTFTQSIKLKSKTVAKQAPSGSLGICLAPLYGRPNEKKMLEWRTHHAQLGVKVVHWYDRDQRGRTKEWVKELNRLLELEDTYTEAPCISPESCGKEEVLEDKGVSGDQVSWIYICLSFFPEALVSSLREERTLTDWNKTLMLVQVLYYADCLARSRHTHPTEWLAMIDFDEYLFPTSQNVTLSSFLSSQANTTAALAFERYIAPSDPLLSGREDGHNNKVSTHPPNLILDKIQTLSTPSEIDRHDNTKMVYRSDALKLAWVHWEVAFRDDTPAREKKVLKASIENGDGISLIHVSNFKGRGPFKMQFDVRSKMEDHVESVRDVYRAMVAKLSWLAS